eukprot:387302-Pyramimonas_sp.AAC.2
MQGILTVSKLAWQHIHNNSALARSATHVRVRRYSLAHLLQHTKRSETAGDTWHNGIGPCQVTDLSEYAPEGVLVRALYPPLEPFDRPPPLTLDPFLLKDFISSFDLLQ